MNITSNKGEPSIRVLLLLLLKLLLLLQQLQPLLQLLLFLLLQQLLLLLQLQLQLKPIFIEGNVKIKHILRTFAITNCFEYEDS